MNKLEQLVYERLFVWPEGIARITVGRRNEWMLAHKPGAETVPEQVQRTFAALGPCSSYYSHNSCTEEQFNKINAKRYQTTKEKETP